MARRKKIYEGKAKILYEGPQPGTIVQYFKDDATAFNAERGANFSYLAYDVVSFLLNSLFGLFYSTPNAFLSQPSLASFYRPRFGSTIPKTATTGKVSCK